MDNQLTKQTKVDAINQHIYSINAQIYNLDLTLEEERSKEVIDQEMINQIEAMRPDMVRKINRLEEILYELQNYDILGREENMTSMLTNEDKAAIVTQHIKNVEYSIYNLELSLIEENSVTSPDADKISSLNEQLDDLTSQKAALETELSKL